MTNEETKKLLDEYKNDPVSFRLKYGATAESELLETAHKKGMTKEVEAKKMQYGGMADMSAAPMMQPRKKKKKQFLNPKSIFPVLQNLNDLRKQKAKSM